MGEGESSYKLLIKGFKFNLIQEVKYSKLVEESMVYEL